MRAAVVWVLGAASAAPIAVEVLKEQLQRVLDGVVAEHKGNAALQLGWKSATEEFALAAGVVPRTDGSSKPPRSATVEDTFLFGSGTKPLTATAVMALRDRGALSLDDPLEQHVDSVFQRLKPGTSLRGLFGVAAGAITVGHTISMRSGVPDFDLPEFDNYLLRANESFRVHGPLEFVDYVASKQPMGWADLDVMSLLPAKAREVLVSTHFFRTENLTKYLTVPGRSGGGWAKTPPTLIWNQSSTIMGWTCGNMVGTALDMARFMWALLGPEADMLKASTIKQMEQFRTLSRGWAAGFLRYGEGLMTSSVTWTGHAPTAPDWGTYIGHGGDTYGFLSEQGILSQLNVSLSIVANQDTDGGIVQRQAFCKSLVVAAKLLAHKTLPFRCGKFDPSSQKSAEHLLADREVFVV